MDHSGGPHKQVNSFAGMIPGEGIAMNSEIFSELGYALMRGRPFQPGNKYGRGRPRGSRNKVTRVCQDILDSYAEPLMKKFLVMALQGNPTVMRIFMDRLMPARGQSTLRFKLPPTKSIDDVAAASQAVVNGVARGQLTPAEGQAFCGMLEGRRRVIEIQDQEPRIRALEDLNKPPSGPR